MHAKGNDPYEQRQNGGFSELVVLVVKENRALSDADEYRTYIYIDYVYIPYFASLSRLNLTLFLVGPIHIIVYTRYLLG